MSKMIVLLMDQQYPFTQNQNHDQSYENCNILVRQTLLTNQNTKPSILAKSTFVKNLRNKYLVKVDSILQQQNTIHIMFEYVEHRLTHILNSDQVSTLLINKIYAQLSQFGRYLSNIGVRMIYNIDRMGWNQKQSLKYFMGLDFQWEEDPDQEYLQQFYDKQLQQLLGGYMCKSYRIAPVPSPSSPSIHEYVNDKNRKVSISTLPSRYNRLKAIDSKIKQIKSSPKQVSISPTSQTSIALSHSNHSPVHALSQQEEISRKQIFRKPSGSSDNIKFYGTHAIKQHVVATKSYKKIEDRKYSGDVKYQITSTLSKLQQKESDIQSQYWKGKKIQIKKQQVQILKSQAGTSQSKSKRSRAEQIRQTQYREISSQKKDYLKDFISVLQEQQFALPHCDTDQHNLIQYCERRSSLFKEIREQNQHEHYQAVQHHGFIPESAVSIVMDNNYDNMVVSLQEKAKQAIQNSMKIMNKFKSIINGL